MLAATMASQNANSGNPHSFVGCRYSATIMAAVGNHSDVKWLDLLESARLSSARKNTVSVASSVCLSQVPLRVVT